MSILTYIHYQSGRQPRIGDMERVIRFVVTSSQWIDPKYFGPAEAESVLPAMPSSQVVDYLLRFYEKEGSVALGERRGLRVNISPPGPTLSPGHIVWEAPIRHPALNRAAHVSSVWHLMRLIHAPLAEAMAKDEHEAFTWRLVEREGYEEPLLTVRG